MSIFDQFSFSQRVYAIQQLSTLIEMLKEANIREHLSDQGQLMEIGGMSVQTAEQKIFEFCLNHFGAPYSSEGREG